MNSCVIVVSDVGSDFFSRLVEVVINIHRELTLNRSKARFHEGIVVAVVSSTHALGDLPLFEQLTILSSCVLAAAIAVMNQSISWPPIGNRGSQWRENELLLHGHFYVPN